MSSYTTTLSSCIKDSLFHPTTLPQSLYKNYFVILQHSLSHPATLLCHPTSLTVSSTTPTVSFYNTSISSNNTHCVILQQHSLHYVIIKHYLYHATILFKASCNTYYGLTTTLIMSLLHVILHNNSSMTQNRKHTVNVTHKSD